MGTIKIYKNKKLYSENNIVPKAIEKKNIFLEMKFKPLFPKNFANILRL